jgi:hypothetical protein
MNTDGHRYGKAFKAGNTDSPIGDRSGIGDIIIVLTDCAPVGLEILLAIAQGSGLKDWNAVETDIF